MLPIVEQLSQEQQSDEGQQVFLQTPTYTLEDSKTLLGYILATVLGCIHGAHPFILHPS